MISKICICATCAVFTGSAQADLFRMVLSSELTRVEDMRTSGSDPFAGTAWDVDEFMPQVGDAWSYEVIFDTDILPDDVKDGEHAIWGGHFESTFTVAGRTTEGFNSFLYHYLVDQYPDDIHQTNEIWGENALGLGVYTGFYNYDELDVLINDGEIITSSDAFDGDTWNGLYAGDSDGSLVLQTDAATPFSFTVTQIPAPSSLMLIGLGGVGVLARRR
jgi:hypothetical protein